MWDIYGNPLRSGFCEVHPDVRGDYPCALCIQESHESERAREYEEGYRQFLETEYVIACAEQLLADGVCEGHA